MKSKFCCVLLVLACGVASAAQIKVPESWDRLAAKADDVVNVTLDKKMLAFASKFMEDEDDQEAKQLIANLNGIYVRSLEFRHPGAYTEADVESIRAQLRGPEWSRIVGVTSRAEGENVEIYVKTVNNQSVGVVILAQEPTQLTFVHLDGPISPEQLGELAGNFGIPRNLPVLQNKSAKKPTNTGDAKPPRSKDEVKR